MASTQELMECGFPQEASFEGSWLLATPQAQPAKIRGFSLGEEPRCFSVGEGGMGKKEGSDLTAGSVQYVWGSPSADPGPWTF